MNTLLDLSIIMPCFNCEKTIKEAVDSIYFQELKFSFEIIMIDDGSNDNTWAILNNFKSKFKEVRVLQNTQNMGESYTRNKAINMALGELIIHLDADDLWPEKCINTMIDFFNSNSYDGIYYEKHLRFQKCISKHTTHDFSHHHNATFDTFFQKFNVGHIIMKKETYQLINYYNLSTTLGNVCNNICFFGSGFRLGICPNTTYASRFFSPFGKSSYEREFEEGFILIDNYLVLESILHLFSDQIINKLLIQDFFTKEINMNSILNDSLSMFNSNYKQFLKPNSLISFLQISNDTKSTELIYQRAVAFFLTKNIKASLNCISMLDEYFQSRPLVQFLKKRCSYVDDNSQSLVNYTKMIAPSFFLVKKQKSVRPSFFEKFKKKLSGVFLNE